MIALREPGDLTLVNFVWTVHKANRSAELPRQRKHLVIRHSLSSVGLYAVIDNLLGCLWHVRLRFAYRLQRLEVSSSQLVQQSGCVQGQKAASLQLDFHLAQAILESLVVL